jgi:dipeptidyl aminopeptidase/acylaminoacyl peptidase
VTIEIENYAEYKIEEIEVKSSIDDSMEPSLFCAAEGDEERPLLVSLHSWSANRHNQVNTFYDMVKKHNWHVLWPEFRGPNLTTSERPVEACASILARQDIVDAVEYVCKNYNVKEEEILLVGGSGGGHMAMMMTAYRPKLWRSVAAFCGITDLAVWHGETSGRYSIHMEACCGGAPSEETASEYEARSPISYAEDIAKANELYIYHGKYDASVPVTHGTSMYQKIFEADPESRVFLNVFDGTHEQRASMAEEQFLKSLSEKEEESIITG